MTRLSLALLLALALAGAGAAPLPPPPRCRVEALYVPSFGSEFGSLMVRLLPGCPEHGSARVRLGSYGGPGSQATGPTETLTRERAGVLWAMQPRWRSVLWEAESGKQYPVPIQGR